jgi:CubicO group peptidase (beta-lactamase class C family)
MEIVNGIVGKTVHQYLELLVPYGFAGAVLVSQHGEILLNQGYGLANLPTKTPNHADTIFNLGSITKQFTATAILRLEMGGLLSTADPIARFIPEVPSDKQKITLHHLLTHTAGTHPSSGEDYEAASRADMIQTVMETPLLFTPGSAYRYSNAGYSLLAAIIEIVSGQEYEQYLAKEFFGPAGMQDTGYRMPAWDAGRLARGYVNGEDKGIPIEKVYPSWNVIGNGEMLSTTYDMYRWYLFLKQSHALSDAARKKLWTPFLQDYAYGWLVHETEFGPVVEHNGAGDMGMSAVLKWYTKADIFVMLYSNRLLSNGTLPITSVDQKVSCLLFGRSFSMPPALRNGIILDAADKYLGDYMLPGGAQFTILKGQDGLMLHPNNQTAIDMIWPVHPEINQRFRKDNQRVKIAFGSLFVGDIRPLEEELGDQARAERYLKHLENVLFAGSPTDPRNVHTNWSVIGTVPGIEVDQDVTRMIVQAGKQQRNLEVYWKDEKIQGLRVMEGIRPLSIPLQPSTEHAFFGYDINTNQIIQVTFDTSSGGALQIKIDPKTAPGGSFCK